MPLLPERCNHKACCVTSIGIPDRLPRFEMNLENAMGKYPCWSAIVIAYGSWCTLVTNYSHAQQ
jgi:hypothetical protein